MQWLTWQQGAPGLISTSIQFGGYRYVENGECPHHKPHKFLMIMVIFSDSLVRKVLKGSSQTVQYTCLELFRKDWEPQRYICDSFFFVYYDWQSSFMWSSGVRFFNALIVISYRYQAGSVMSFVWLTVYEWYLLRIT